MVSSAPNPSNNPFPFWLVKPRDHKSHLTPNFTQDVRFQKRSLRDTVDESEIMTVIVHRFAMMWRHWD